MRILRNPKSLASTSVSLERAIVACMVVIATITFSATQATFARGGSSDDTAVGGDSSNYSNFTTWAKHCGETMQNRFKNERSPRTGSTMCAKSVRFMVHCYATNLGFAPECNMDVDGCGDSRMWSECSTGALAKCGYKRVENPADPACSKSGAVRVYNKSGTKWGNLFGHVEFAMADGVGASVYDPSITGFWPRPTPDWCWVPVNAVVEQGSLSPASTYQSQASYQSDEAEAGSRDYADYSNDYYSNSPTGESSKEIIARGLMEIALARLPAIFGGEETEGPVIPKVVKRYSQSEYAKLQSDAMFATGGGEGTGLANADVEDKTAKKSKTRKRQPAQQKSSKKSAGAK